MLRSTVWGISLKLVSPTNFAGCDASQTSQLQQAFKDAALLASKAVKFDINLYASMEFFGAPAYVHGGNHTIIQNNFARAAAYQPRWDDWLRNSYLNLTCNDFAGRCGSTTFAYHVDPEPKPYPVLNFCPLFFEQRSFEGAVEYAMADRERSYDLRSYDNKPRWAHESTCPRVNVIELRQGMIFLHEILHIDAVGQPKITDIMETTCEGREYGPALGPLRCKYLAFFNERNNVAETVRNGGSCLPMYVQERIGYPHKPVIWEPEESTSTVFVEQV
ncbi:hypothetical protein B0H14DRAFT_2691161 [Mycena olivaceomarginata]|nr:hypothetical protein B0H14DRAFT_2691161 [Mycena olivaceomarginata]